MLLSTAARRCSDGPEFRRPLYQVTSRANPARRGSGIDRGIRALQQRVRAAAVQRRRTPPHHGRGRDRQGGRPGRLQVHVGDRAPLPHGVLAPLRERGVPRVPRRGHRLHAHRLGDLQRHPAGEPPGPHRRARRDARSSLGGALRVRHGPRLVDHRAEGVRHHRSRPHPRHVRRGGRRVPPRCGRPRSTRASTASSSPCRRATCCPSRTPTPAPADVGRGRAIPRRSRRPRRWGSACCASRSAVRSRSSRSSRSTRTRSRTRIRSAASSTTTSW